MFFLNVLKYLSPSSIIETLKQLSLYDLVKLEISSRISKLSQLYIILFYKKYLTTHIMSLHSRYIKKIDEKKIKEKKINEKFIIESWVNYHILNRVTNILQVIEDSEKKLVKTIPCNIYSCRRRHKIILTIYFEHYSHLNCVQYSFQIIDNKIITGTDKSTSLEEICKFLNDGEESETFLKLTFPYHTNHLGIRERYIRFDGGDKIFERYIDDKIDQLTFELKEIDKKINQRNDY